MDYSTPVFPVQYQFPELTQTHVHRVGDATQSSHPLSSLLLLPSIFPSIRVFSNESVLRIRWPKYWSFSFSVSPSNEYSGLISIRIDWFDVVYTARWPIGLWNSSSSGQLGDALSLLTSSFRTVLDSRAIEPQWCCLSCPTAHVFPEWTVHLGGVWLLPGVRFHIILCFSKSQAHSTTNLRFPFVLLLDSQNTRAVLGQLF